MIKKARLLIAFTLMLFASAASAQVASRLFSEAKAADAAGERDAAFLLYRQIVREYPDSEFAEESLFLIGQYYFDFRNYFEADKAFRQHIQKFPRSRFNKAANDYLAKMGLRSLRDRADALFDQGNLATAGVLYQQYLEVDPDNAEVKARLEKMKKAQEEGHFGFEQLNRERKKLEQEKAGLAVQVSQLEQQKKEVEAQRKKAEELNKGTVERYEKQLAAANSQIETMKQEISKLQDKMQQWRQRAVFAEAAKLSQPLAKRFTPAPDEKSLPRIIFDGGKPDPSPEEGEVQISNVLREGFPVVVITEAKIDAEKRVCHVETVVIADLTSPWPEGAKIKFRVDFVGKDGKPAPDPKCIVRYYDDSEMEEIDENAKSYRKRVLFTADEDKVARYEVSAFLVKSQ